MEHDAAIDVSLEWSSGCGAEAARQIGREAKVRSEREALVAFFAQSGLSLAHIGLEAGPLSQWLYAGPAGAGLPAILIETRHVKAALKAMTVKTDRNEARGMAQLTRMGWFRVSSTATATNTSALFGIYRWGWAFRPRRTSTATSR